MADSTKVFPPGFRAEDDNGIIIAGGTVEFFFAGTTDPMTVYSDKDLLTSLGTSVGLNAGGYPVSSGGTRVIVYASTDTYRIRLKDDEGVVVWEHDNVQGALDTGDFADLINSQLPSGTVQLFGQTNAPPGWTKSVSHDNAAPRIVSGSASSGGSANFTTAFSSRTLTRANMPNASVSVTITDTGHVHDLGGGNNTAGSSFVPVQSNNVTTTLAGGNNGVKNNTTGISAAFNFNGNVSQQSLDFAVKYVDFIIATKD